MLLREDYWAEDQQEDDATRRWMIYGSGLCEEMKRKAEDRTLRRSG